MEQYNKASYAISKLVTTSYSTSFGLSIRLFEPALRPHIYAIYGLVRIADEIVDSYAGPDTLQLLNDLEADTYAAIVLGYSTNPIIHAFALTARVYRISTELIESFFTSMRMDVTPQIFDQKKYDQYIYGSAEVVGLMCLKIFTDNDKLYKKLQRGAGKLGAAYQKINFLRDIAADSEGLGRWYFPLSSAATFDDAAKNLIVKDIEQDLAAAAKVIKDLPHSSRRSVELSYRYYSRLLAKIKHTPVQVLLTRRVRINDIHKLALFMQVSLSGKNRA